MNREQNDDQLWLDKKDIINVANNKVKEAISNALHLLSSSLIFPKSSSATSNVLLRFRSSSHNRSDRKITFHNIIPRFSLPATSNDLVHSQSSLLPYQQTHCRTSRNINSNEFNRTFDVHYSFSLSKPWLDKQRHNLINVQNFVNELIEYSIRTALFQIDYQNLTTEDETTCVPIEHLPAINSFVDGFLQSMIEQSIENIFSSDTEHLSYHLTENIITDALSTIANDEKYLRKLKKRPIRRLYNSSFIFQSLTNDNSSNQETIDTIVNATAQKMYIDSFDQLRQIFAKDESWDDFIYL